MAHSFRSEGEAAVSGPHDPQIGRLADLDIAGVAIGNHSGLLLEANDAFLRIHGYTRDELETIDWHQFTPAEWLPLTLLMRSLSCDYSNSVSYEKEHYRKDGSLVPIAINLQTICSGNLSLCTVIDRSTQQPSNQIIPQADFLAAKERFGLTHREHEVLTYVIDGSSNAEIADALVISRSTVTEHVQNILRKAGVENRGKLAKRVFLDCRNQQSDKRSSRSS